MTIERITFRQVEALRYQIEALKADPEAFHGAEDDLYLRVLKGIAAGSVDPQALAAEALKLSEIDVERWCA